MKTKEYIAVKNFVHNELKLTKNDFLELMKQAVQEEAKAFVQRKFQDSETRYEELAKLAITSEAKSILTGRQHGTQADKMFTFIGKEIANQFTIKLKEKE
jgi:Holliday junction resolvase